VSEERSHTIPSSLPKAQKRPKVPLAPSGPEKTMEGGRRRTKRSVEHAQEPAEGAEEALGAMRAEGGR
jgi:hypothetical protein